MNSWIVILLIALRLIAICFMQNCLKMLIAKLLQLILNWFIRLFTKLWRQSFSKFQIISCKRSMNNCEFDINRWLFSSIISRLSFISIEIQLLLFQKHYLSLSPVKAQNRLCNSTEYVGYEFVRVWFDNKLRIIERHTLSNNAARSTVKTTPVKALMALDVMRRRRESVQMVNF